MFYINCGKMNTSTPAALAKALQAMVVDKPSEGVLKFLENAANGIMLHSDTSSPEAMAAADVLSSFFHEYFPQDKAMDFDSVINSMKILLQEVPPGREKPVIAIGRWPPAEVSSFLAFLILFLENDNFMLCHALQIILTS